MMTRPSLLAVSGYTVLLSFLTIVLVTTAFQPFFCTTLRLTDMLLQTSCSPIFLNAHFPFHAMRLALCVLYVLMLDWIVLRRVGALLFSPSDCLVPYFIELQSHSPTRCAACFALTSSFPVFPFLSSRVGFLLI